ncbi:MAG: hypothetical protein ABSH45_18890, partial [Bryobacteraceae bacterium]
NAFAPGSLGGAVSRQQGGDQQEEGTAFHQGYGSLLRVFAQPYERFRGFDKTDLPIPWLGGKRLRLVLG